jgi:D-alanine transaminase
VASRPIRKDDLAAAREVLIFGTTTNVTSVTQIDGQPVGEGRPGPVFAGLSRLLLHEQFTDNPHTVAAFA